MKKKFRYPTVITMTSLQYSNHLREYFVENSEKTIAYYVLPRKGKVKNFVEVYEKGVKKLTYDLYSPSNIFLWHIMLYVHYLRILFRYTSKNEKIYFINYLFTLSFLSPVVKLFREVNFVVWVGDYWPMKDLSIRIYMFFLHYFHDHSPFAFYQTDRINRKMNKGKLLNTFNRKTIIPGVNPPRINFSKKIKKSLTLCFIGVLVPWQGVEILLEAISKSSNTKLKLIGTGDSNLVKKYKDIIKSYAIQDRVYFPNTFLYGKELENAVADSDIGIALYKIDSLSVSYFGDPAKVKQYIEYGLPIVMTDAAEIASLIKKFNSGVVVEREPNSVNKAIERVRKNYNNYLKNLEKMSSALDFRKYYIDKFSFMEEKHED